MALGSLVDLLGPEIDDPEEESFLLFAQDLPPHNLGFVDPSRHSIELTVAGHDLTIHQSPTILSSNRAGGTTGAVLWKITPLLADWLASPDNLLFASDQLGPRSAVLELGCGISALLAVALGPRVARLVLTDQPYVARLVAQNLAENRGAIARGRRKTGGTGVGAGAGAGGGRTAARRLRGKVSSSSSSSSSSLPRHNNNGSAAADGPDQKTAGFTTPDEDRVLFQPLDWETDEVGPSSLAIAGGFDAVVACDCVYNEALIEPFLQTCADACRLRSSSSFSSFSSFSNPREDSGRARSGGHYDDTNDGDGKGPRPCACIVAQQLRDPDVFESWARAFHRVFRTWRVPDKHLPPGLRASTGFVVHIGFLR